MELRYTLRKTTTDLKNPRYDGRRRYDRDNEKVFPAGTVFRVSSGKRDTTFSIPGPEPGTYLGVFSLPSGGPFPAEFAQQVIVNSVPTEPRTAFEFLQTTELESSNYYLELLENIWRQPGGAEAVRKATEQVSAGF